METKTFLNKNKGTIVDVRTPVEFMSGHVPRSINIPLQDISKRIPELKNLTPPLILCCASGARSAQATRMLTEHGIECKNGGSWLSLNYSQPKSV